MHCCCCCLAGVRRPKGDSNHVNFQYFVPFAVLTFGLSSEYVSTTKEGSGKAPDADRHMYSRYYVRSLLKLDEEALKNAWSKVR